MIRPKLDRPSEFQRRIPPAPVRERYQGCLLEEPSAMLWALRLNL